jgi:hypothetical protein
MTFANLQALYYVLLRESSSNTSVSTTNCKLLLNIANKIISSSLKWSNTIAMVSRTMPATTVATKVSDTSWTLTSGTGFYAGQYICMHTAGRFDYARIATLATNAITLTSPGIPYAHTAGAYVTGLSNVTPNNSDIISVKWREVTATKSEAVYLRGLGIKELDKDTPYPTSEGQPKVWTYTQYSTATSATGDEFMVLPVSTTTGYVDIVYRTIVTTDMSADGDLPTIDALFHPGIVYYALAMTGFRNRDKSLMDFGMSMFGQTLQLGQNIIGSRTEMNEAFGFRETVEGV